MGIGNRTMKQQVTDASMFYQSRHTHSPRMFLKKTLTKILWTGLFLGLGLSGFAGPEQRSPADSLWGYRWDPNHPPRGRNPLYLAAWDNHYALKTNKYLEGYLDLGQGPNEMLRFSGPMTLTAVFQIAKQWPMKAALISKWGWLPGQASYELGTTPDSRVYFQISPTGSPEDAVELLSAYPLEKETPVVVTAVFDPAKRMALFVNGKISGEKTLQVPAGCYEGSAPVKLGPRFEGLLAGVWFGDRVLTDSDISDLHTQLSDLLPDGVPYEKWTVLPQRTVLRNEPTFLGTTRGVKLYKEIDILPYKGSYLCPGDLDNDGKIDFILYKNGNTYTVPGRLTAIDFDGKLLWEKGDLSLTVHEKCGSAAVGEKGTSPALRGIVTIFDIDEDGRSEVICELWEDNQPMLYILDGATGRVKHGIPSPLSLKVRQPDILGDRQSSRSHPIIRIAYLDGRRQPPSIILKFGASNGLPCHAFALDSQLKERWHIEGTSNSMGHIPTAADVDNDGKEEIVLGHMLADEDGRVLWDKGQEFTWHADTTEAAALMNGPEKQILISVCGVGPVYCLDVAGHILWQKSREEVSHGQAVWAGNFLKENEGLEVIACTSGHSGQFVTLRGSDGRTLAVFEHKKLLPAYPDFPAVVNWESRTVQSLWLPQDRILVDGEGTVIAELGDQDAYVQEKLHCGTSWRPVGAQAFALDILGDQRDELILYEPYEGQSIFIFSNPDSDQVLKKYVPQPAAYNIRSYF